MPTRRVVLKVGLLGGIAASVGRVAPTLARGESTPEAEPWSKNGILVQGIDELPRAKAGEMAGVAWGGGPDLDGAGRVYMLVHNATDDELIMRQGTATAVDADGNILAESEFVNTAPYSLEPDSYGANYIGFNEDITGATDIVLEIPTSPISEATGQLANVDVIRLEHTSDRLAEVWVKNNSSLTLSWAPIVGIYFDDEMEIVGGTSNPVMGPVTPGSEASLSMSPWWGVKTDRYFFACMGAE